MDDDAILQASVDGETMIVMDLVIIPGGPCVLDQLAGGRLLHQCGQRVPNIQIVVEDRLFGHRSYPRYSRMMPVLRPLATTSPCWFLKVSSVITKTILPVRPVRSFTSAYLAVTVMVSPAESG